MCNFGSRFVQFGHQGVATLNEMSNTKFDSDGFQIVSSKRFSKNKATKIPQKDSKVQIEDPTIDRDKSVGRIHSAVADLQCSKYLEDILESVSTIVQSRKVGEIVCFGLGHIAECSISRHQLALLLCLKEKYTPSKVLVHDPIFYRSECEILKQLGLEIIEENKEGYYITSDKSITLIYLPHCPKQLTNNLLWSNWGSNLKHCILICNSFSSLIVNQTSRELKDSCPFIQKIFPYTTETTLENSFKYSDIFNDTSIHHFPAEKLENLDSNFWDKGQKPEYENCEEFITSCMIEKLSI